MSNGFPFVHCCCSPTDFGKLCAIHICNFIEKYPFTHIYGSLHKSSTDINLLFIQCYVCIPFFRIIFSSSWFPFNSCLFCFLYLLHTFSFVVCERTEYNQHLQEGNNGGENTTASMFEKSFRMLGT